MTYAMYKKFCQYLAVTLVPIVNWRGILSGRSLKLETSFCRRCWSSRIFALLRISSERSWNKRRWLIAALDTNDAISRIHFISIIYYSFALNTSKKNAAEHLLGFPINRRILHHSIRVKRLVFKSGKLSRKQTVKSFSPSNKICKKHLDI